MSPNLESPVQTQMAVAVLKSPLGGEYHGKQSERKPAGRRRVFVQTDTGSVLGIELERGDNAHTVKRKLQLALHVPTEESSLTFGDLILKNDLSAVRNDVALRLTKNVMHRSSSMPCLSPTGRDLQHRDRSGPIEILCCAEKCSKTKQLVKEAIVAIKNGIDPIPANGGLGGAYYFRNPKGERVAIVKPTDEEPFAPNNPKGFVGKALGQPGLKRSVRVGETGMREVAAYLLDYDNFANVPPTVLVKATHSVFCINEGVDSNRIQNRRQVSKIASFQQFIPHDFDAGDYGTSSFPVSAVHRIGILDIRILNTDRHAGNLLVKKLDNVGRFGQVELIPIDHGMCLPEDLEDPYFEWLHWPQASIPFSDDELKYIERLDPIKDAELLKAELPMFREACLRVLILCTIFLKEAAAFGLSLSEIGGMMSREFHGMEEEPSELELVCVEARRLVDEESLSDEVDEEEEEEDGSENDLEQFQFHIDCEEDFSQTKQSKVNYRNETRIGSFSVPSLNIGFKHFPPSSFVSPKGGSRRSPLSKLDESPEEDEMEAEVEESATVSGQKSAVHKLSTSFKCIGITGKHQRHGGVRGDCSSSGMNRRSAEEQVQAGASFVKLSDMSSQEWGAFLRKFKGLLNDAFANRKDMSMNQRHRLGTSCQF
ncbi:phosphatidylinositol 4-kinase gamma 5-like [Nymphaea colorata]|nr:phosphatidylinositol 4-kinase gamma 5-like [Nymphaea colorata]XP_031479274.1 phosphatidylinositol 4-kinase gamma 5-like [Nymphaea colorata]XP_031479275.1 phosphatidylinositol 4-kinase gamma 5-like [Nymphaea colorata]XP_031479276.1 phosphatidylinositol 4-kinase gamma 5-like [Nymphaea colorata]